MERADIAIIGTGPAGVSAAITAKVRGKTVLLFGSRELSSKLTKAHKIQNYPGLPDIDGAQLAQAFKKHLDVLEIPITEKQVTAVYAMGGYFGIQTPDAMLEASSVILAGGVVMGKPFPKEDELLGRGVSYCAVCDAFFYRGKTAAVIGAGEYALHEAQVLLPHAAKVMMLTNGAEPAVRIPETIEVHREPVSAVEGEQRVRSVRLDDGTALAADGVFLALGTAGSTDLARKIGALTDGSSIRVDEHMATNVPGLFAAGDCTGGLLQIAKAVWQGAEAGLSAIRYLRQKQA